MIQIFDENPINDGPVRFKKTEGREKRMNDRFEDDNTQNTDQGHKWQIEL